MKLKLLSLHFLQDLNEAIANGFNHNFIVCPDGLLKSLSIPDTRYEIDQLDIIVSSYPDERISLYLITTNDGVKGHLIDCWECSSHD